MTYFLAALTIGVSSTGEEEGDEEKMDRFIFGYLSFCDGSFGLPGGGNRI